MTTSAQGTTPGIVVRPVRFTDRLPEMQAFLELLGLRPLVSSVRPGWVDLAGSAGRVALHSASGSTTGGRHGETRLSFEVADPERTATTLTRAGYDASWIDEAYGRSVFVADPLGAELILDGGTDDLHGYVLHDPTPPGAPAPVVVPVRFTDEADRYHAFLTSLGLVGEAAPGGYTTYAAPGGGGFVGVHYVYGDDLPIVAGTDGAVVQLTLGSSEDLAAVTERLKAAGHPATLEVEDFGSFIVVTDPDGQEVQVHLPPSP